MGHVGEAFVVFVTVIVLLAGICMAVCIFLLLDVDNAQPDESPAKTTRISVKGLTLPDIHERCACSPDSSPSYEYHPRRGDGGRALDDSDETPRAYETDLLEVISNRTEPPRQNSSGTNTWKYHQRLASVSLQRHPQDPDDVAFECSAFALNESHVLAVSGCVNGETLSTLRVRLASRLWSSGGREHAATKITAVGDLTLISVVPFMNVSEFAVGLKKADFVWREATSAGWIIDERVYSTYEVSEWRSSRCESCSRVSIGETVDCRRPCGDPLVVNDILMGLRACGNDFVAVPDLLGTKFNNA